MLQAKFSSQTSSRASAHQHDQSRASQPAQMMRAGLIPGVPGTYRATTTITANNSFAAIDGAKSFNNSQKSDVIDDNDTNTPTAVLTQRSHPLQDDEDNSALLSPQTAATLAPEVDHIVPVAMNGANDVRNARVLSKSNNINSNHRPNEQGRRIAVYENVMVNSNNYNAGDMLSTADANKVKTTYGAANKADAVAAMDGRSANQVGIDTL